MVVTVATGRLDVPDLAALLSRRWGSGAPGVGVPFPAGLPFSDDRPNSIRDNAATCSDNGEPQRRTTEQVTFCRHAMTAPR